MDVTIRLKHYNRCRKQQIYPSSYLLFSASVIVLDEIRVSLNCYSWTLSYVLYDKSGANEPEAKSMKHLFWLIPGEIAGRPGPDEEPWDVEELWQGGVQAILSVNDGRLCDPLAFACWGIAYACCPLSDWVPPQPGDAEVSWRALQDGDAFVQAQRRQGRPVLVHCSGGNDRTGLFLSYYLVRHAQLSATQAIQRVRALRPTALSAEGWAQFAEELLQKVAQNKS